MTRPNLSRREFLAASATPVLAGRLAAAAYSADRSARAPGPLRLAAVNSIYRLRSHAYHICGRFILGYEKDGFHHRPPFQLVRMFNHQHPKGDMEREISARHGVQIARSVAEALGGEKSLDVDGVLLIIEHGDYPINERMQMLYPRYELFEEIVDVFRKSGRSVPVFVDKHLSYDYQKAAKMAATAKELGFPMMAGSSLPVTWRRPEIEPPLGTPFEEGICCFGFGGSEYPEEIYLFHALETLQCMLERRPGGETGVKSVLGLQGEAVWKAGDEGRWSWKLLDAALSRCPTRNIGAIRDNVKNPTAILIEYRDGTKGAVINLYEHVADHGFAATVKGHAEPISSCFFLPGPPGANFFNPLCYNIERMFLDGKPPYPVERTLLTSTVLDWGLRSIYDKKGTVADPSLNIAYSPPEQTGFFRGPMTDGGAM
jgi:hypothetical protein